MAAAGVVEQADIGQNRRIDTEFRRPIDGLVPVGLTSRLREGIDRHQDFLAALMRIADTFDERLLVKVEPGEVACVGIVLVAEINRIGTIIDSGFQGGQATGGANKFEHGVEIQWLVVKCVDTNGRSVFHLSSRDDQNTLGLRCTLANSRSYSPLGRRRRTLATIPICQGITT